LGRFKANIFNFSDGEVNTSGGLLKQHLRLLSLFGVQPGGRPPQGIKVAGSCEYYSVLLFLGAHGGYVQHATAKRVFCTTKAPTLQGDSERSLPFRLNGNFGDLPGAACVVRRVQHLPGFEVSSRRRI
jgi:hypothetical protein